MPTKSVQSFQSASYWNVSDWNSIEIVKQDLPSVQTCQILKTIWVVAEAVEIFICLLLRRIYRHRLQKLWLYNVHQYTHNIIILYRPWTKTAVSWHPLLFTIISQNLVLYKTSCYVHLVEHWSLDRSGRFIFAFLAQLMSFSCVFPFSLSFMFFSESSDACFLL